MPELVHELLENAAERRAAHPALVSGATEVTYETLAEVAAGAARGLSALGLSAGDRVAVYLEKRVETIAALFATSRAGGVFVPVNPVLKGPQVAHVLRDCRPAVLLTSPERFAAIGPTLEREPFSGSIVLIGDEAGDASIAWSDLVAGAGDPRGAPRCDAEDPATILYTSGSTGMPKGVVLSHRNLVTGAESVVDYLGQREDDRVLAVLPLSFDAGLSQITTSVLCGASVALLNYLLPVDVVRAADRYAVTSITAVPPLWIALGNLDWPSAVRDRLRTVASTGGAMPHATIEALRRRLPRTRLFIMYGFTEAFRSTYLDPDALESRPGSIGKAIPHAEVVVVREDGTRCDADEPGELVHRGPLVAKGYWNAPRESAERFRPIADDPHGAIPTAWSGDRVRADADGYLHFITRSDEMIKTSGYRVSPTEVESVVYDGDGVAEVAAFGVPHPILGEEIAVSVCATEGCVVTAAGVIEACRRRAPSYMVPAHVDVRHEPLPRGPNGKFDRLRMKAEIVEALAATPEPTGGDTHVAPAPSPVGSNQDDTDR